MGRCGGYWHTCEGPALDFISTRDPKHTLHKFSDILLEGLANDDGLYLPVGYPQVNDATLTCRRSVLIDDGYAALAAEIVSLSVDDIPLEGLRSIYARIYTCPKFSDPNVVPVTKLEDQLYIGHLSMSPTVTLKNMAIQLLDEFFGYELARRGETLNILGATSGDTGSSAEYTVHGHERINVFMLIPAGRMTAFRQAQMFSLQDASTHNVALDGVFDDCQDIAEAISDDLDYKASRHIGTVNSISWARLMTQTMHYVPLRIRVTGSNGAEADNTQKVSFSVPAGDFGDICAGHIAHQVGMPIGCLIVATNENDILDEFFRTGAYHVRSATETQVTSSPSMDISRASNFEYFIFGLLERGAERIADLFDVEVKEGGFSFTTDPIFPEASAQYGFLSGRSAHAGRVETIKDCWEHLEVMIDPHTADGIHIARGLVDQVSTPVVCLETTLPIEFSETILEVTGREPDCPERFADIVNAPHRVTELLNDVDVVKKFIDDNVV